VNESGKVLEKGKSHNNLNETGKRSKQPPVPEKGENANLSNQERAKKSKPRKARN